MVQLSVGQQLALEQLEDIANRSEGALEVLSETEIVRNEAYVRVRISLATDGYRENDGFQFRGRERLHLLIHHDFPFAKPLLYFVHTRFLGQPHVQWGRYICLYQSPETEYQPSDGLFGFFERVDIWMTAAGSGQLDPADAPLHPPVAYPKSPTTFVVKADTPAERPEVPFWLGRVDLARVRDGRFDVLSWTHLDDWDDSGPDHPIAVAVLLKSPLATEYPSKIYDLIKFVEGAGLHFGMLYRMLRFLSLLTPHGEPAYFVLGAPMRRRSIGEPLRPHLTVWEIDAEPVSALRTIVRGADEDQTLKDEVIDWLANADLKWCNVMEDRPEIVQRRDNETTVSWVKGKRVLLFGCGALGSAVAEIVVRAGAASVELVDKAHVRPGILVRQRYSDSDIGLPKASALQNRLMAFGLPCAVSVEIRDLADGALRHFKLDDWDILIDATASVSVHHRIEQELKELVLPISLLSLSCSAAAQHGAVTVKMPKYCAGPYFIARQAKLEALALDFGHPLITAFWPARIDMKIFQPEPGCSDPTFIGSAADIDHHAAGLLNLGLLRMQSLQEHQASVDLVSAPWLQRGSRERPHLTYAFSGYIENYDQRHGYSVLRSEIAQRGIVAELRRIARTRSDDVETGGLVFGEVDDSHQQIWIDSVTGPPPDSQATSMQFLCGTSGTKDLALYKAKVSGNSSKFVGIWHSHPISRGRPSQEDLTAILQLLHFQEFTPRHIVMLIVGFSATRPTENYYLFRRNEFTLIAAEEAQLGNGE